MPAIFKIDRNDTELKISPEDGQNPDEGQLGLVKETERIWNFVSHSSFDNKIELHNKIEEVAKKSLGVDPPEISLEEAFQKLALFESQVVAGQVPIPNITYFWVDSDAKRDDIEFSTQSSEKPPDEMLTLKSNIEASLVVLHSLFPADKNGKRGAKFDRYFTSLLGLAQVGLSGKEFNVAVANAALKSLKDGVLSLEGAVVKNRHLKSLGKMVFWVGIPAFGLAIIIQFLGRNVSWGGGAPKLGADIWSKYLVGFDWHFFSALLLMWATCMVGVWVSFGARVTTMTFEDLARPDNGQLEPLLRLVFAGVLTVAFGLIFGLKVATVSIGSVDSSKICSDPNLAILIGFFAGFNERLLSSSIANKATKWFD